MSKTKTPCVMMVGPDTQMDHRGDTYEPANPLPIKCPHCTFPNLNLVPNPYVLTKGISSPAETSSAHFGNFLVRERVRRILEIVVPDACAFYPTVERKSQKTAPWWLVVPQFKRSMPMPKPKPPFCSKCREPKVWSCAMGSVWEKMKSYDSGGIDVFKTIEWHTLSETAEDQFETVNRYRKKAGEPPLSWTDWLRSSTCSAEPPTHRERWTRLGLSHDLYFSVRLEQLFQRAKVKGQLIRYRDHKDVKPSDEDEAWVEKKIQALAAHGLISSQMLTEKKAIGRISRNWFCEFLKRNAGKAFRKMDLDAIEKRQKLMLPKDYKDFIITVGPMSFKHVMEIEGFTATILTPTKLDFKSYRRGSLPYLDKEQSQIDGVMFAKTEHGDAFVFDVSMKKGDYPVYWHDHEQNTLEPFAGTFAECIKRFAHKD